MKGMIKDVVFICKCFEPLVFLNNGNLITLKKAFCVDGGEDVSDT